MENENQIRTAMDAGARLVQPVVCANGREYACIPNDYTIADLEWLQDAPARTRARVLVSDVDSYLRYLQTFRSPQTVIFVEERCLDKGTFRMQAVIDYHGPGEPKWWEHRCMLEITTSREMELWKSCDDQYMPQHIFAEFIEDNLLDIVRPDQAEMLEIARTFEAKRKVMFKSALRQKNGDVTLRYESDTQASAGGIDIPPLLELSFPAVEGGKPRTWMARLRYRISQEGALSMGYQLIRPHLNLRDEYDAIETRVRAETGVPIYVGALLGGPEAD